jgi:CRISPR-associated protein Csm5
MASPEIIYQNQSIPKDAPFSTPQKGWQNFTKEFVIQTLCPVHLGCDDVYDPLSFVLDSQASELIVFDPSEFLENLSEPDLRKFSDICKEGTLSSIIKIYKFMRNKRPLGKRVGVCGGFLDHYEKTLGIPEGNRGRIQNELNRFVISRTAYVPTTDRAYIPGSAVKGAIRTAYLNLLASRKKVNPERGKGKDLEKKLLDGGAFETDPFRLLKVSDFMPVGEIKTKIVYAVNEKKRPSPHEAGGLYQILETIEPGSLFVGSITVEQPEQGAKITNPLTMETLMGSLKLFYSKEKNLENQTLQNVKIPSHNTGPSDATILRLGRHSGAESLTIEGFRDIRIMQGRGGQAKFLPNSTTVWLASDSDKPQNKSSLKPFGWAILNPIAEEEKLKYLETERMWRSVADDEGALALQRIQDSMRILPETRDKVASLPQPTTKPQQSETWKGALLIWDPGRGELMAQFGTKKAFSKDKELVPEAKRKNVFNKKKPIKCDVEVDGSFKIRKIE